jgi:hypothetical protein
MLAETGEPRAPAVLAAATLRALISAYAARRTVGLPLRGSHVEPSTPSRSPRKPSRPRLGVPRSTSAAQRAAARRQYAGGRLINLLSVPWVRPRPLAIIVALALAGAAFAGSSGAHTHPVAAHDHGACASPHDAN